MTDDRFYIKSLSLKNFRRFESLELGPFDPQFNLIVGENGAGKSSVLVALADAIAIHPVNRATPRDGLVTETDVRITTSLYNGNPIFHQNYPLNINAVILFGNHKTESKRVMKDEYIHNMISDEDGIVRRKLKEDFTFGMARPLFAYYDVARFKNDLASRSKKRSSRLDMTNKLRRDWLTAGKNLNDNFDWMALETATLQQRKDRGVSNKESNFLSLTVDALKKNISNVNEIYYDFILEDLIVKFPNGNLQNFSLLSDGYKILISIVVDLVRRACLLNPHLGDNAVKDTPGVVLIDELDLHLHPKWQRKIVANLKAAFPKIQFFATTHSPQIIGEVRPEELIVLGEEGVERPDQSFGLESGQVLDWVMGAESRDGDIAQRIALMWSHIENNRFKEARSVIDELEQRTNGAIPETTEAKSVIKRYELRGGAAAE